MPFLACLLVSILTQPSSAPLRIVVVEGEDAVNIVQQKTAVRPLVEVRDRNNLPVSGATVTFTVGSGQPAAFAGGAQTLTVTTNATGQAAASGFSATGAGKVTIQVQAAHQGQIASAAITQTNFATAAAAAAAGASVGAATAAGGATAGSTGGAGAAGAAGGAGAAGAGGGISATTIAIVGGAVAGGAVVATQTGVIGGGGEATYTGALNGQYVWTNSGRTEIGTPVVCAYTRTLSGTMTMELNEEGTSGRAAVSTTHTNQSVSSGCNFVASTLQHGAETQVAGGPSALSFSYSETGSGSNQNATIRFTFNGALSGSTVTGSLTFETQGQTSAGGNTFTSSGSITIPVTLQR
jgi:hypothetical protein